MWNIFLKNMHFLWLISFPPWLISCSAGWFYSRVDFFRPPTTLLLHTDTLPHHINIKHKQNQANAKRNAQFINLPKCKFEICFLFAFAFDSIHLNLINTYAYIEIVKDTDKYISPSHVTNTTHSLYPSIDFHSSFQQNPNWQIK